MSCVDVSHMYTLRLNFHFNSLIMCTVLCNGVENDDENIDVDVDGC